MRSAPLLLTQPLHEKLLPARAPAWLSCSLLFLLLIVPSYDFRPAAEEQFGLDFQLLVRLAICGACGLYGLIYWHRSYSFLLNFPGAWALVLCLWAALTIPAAESPAYAATAWMVLCCVTLFAPTLLAQLDERHLLVTIFTSALAFIAMTWALYYVVPSIGRSAYMVGGQIEYRVGGDAQQLGLQGVWLIAAVLALRGLRAMSAGHTVLAIAFGLTTIAFAQSRTSFATAICIITLAAFMNGPKTRVLALTSAGAMLASLLLFGFACGLFSVRGADVLALASRSGTQEEIYNVTGRTEFWPFVLERIGESPLWGHGFGSSRQALYEFNGHSYHMGELHHAHNTFLNVMLTMGLAGVLILLAMFAGLATSVVRYRQLFPTFVLATVAIAGLTESLLYGPMPRTHTVLWILALYWQQGLSARTDEVAR